MQSVRCACSFVDLCYSAATPEHQCPSVFIHQTMLLTGIHYKHSCPRASIVLSYMQWCFISYLRYALMCGLCVCVWLCSLQEEHPWRLIWHTSENVSAIRTWCQRWKHHEETEEVFLTDNLCNAVQKCDDVVMLFRASSIVAINIKIIHVRTIEKKRIGIVILEAVSIGILCKLKRLLHCEVY